MEGRAVSVYKHSGLATRPKQSYQLQHKIFECSHSPISLSYKQLKVLWGPNAMRANGRLWILTGYCLVVYGNPGARNLFLCRRTTGRTAQGDAGWTPVQQCARSGRSTVQSIRARGYVSVSCTTAMNDTNGGIATLFI